MLSFVQSENIKKVYLKKVSIIRQFKRHQMNAKAPYQKISIYQKEEGKKS